MLRENDIWNSNNSNIMVLLHLCEVATWFLQIMLEECK